jgi:hypothetical protein
LLRHLRPGRTQPAERFPPRHQCHCDHHDGRVRLLFDGDLGGVCPVCTGFAPAAEAEPFVALVGAELVESADTLDELLATLREILDEKGTEDVVVWRGRRVVLIFRADGRVSDFSEGGASC